MNDVRAGFVPGLFRLRERNPAPALFQGCSGCMNDVRAGAVPGRLPLRERIGTGSISTMNDAGGRSSIRNGF